MTKNLRERAEATAQEVHEILGVPATDRPKEVADAIEHAIIRALVQERHRCADMALVGYTETNAKAELVAEEIRQVRSVLITNLTSMR